MIFKSKFDLKLTCNVLSRMSLNEIITPPTRKHTKRKLCEQDGCLTGASYGKADGDLQFCAKHRTPEMVDLVHKRCEQEGCGTRPTYNVEGGKAIFCKAHKKDGMVNVISKQCEFSGCKTRPSFDIIGGKGRFCIEHKSATMVNVIDKRCEQEDCDIVCPAFDLPGGNGRFCKSHKEEGMVNVVSKLCNSEGCVIRPNFGIEGGTPLYCLEHKTPEMIALGTKQCENTDCKTTATFGVKGGKKQFCTAHKKEGMVDVVNKQCEFEGCDTHPNYGEKGGTAKFCCKHKTKGMVNVNSKTCKQEGCDIQPCFDQPGGKGQFCKTHKTEGMIDVRNKRCEEKGCEGINPLFDIAGGKGRFCAKHKKEGMIDVKSKRCDHKGCDTEVSYGKPGHPETRCFPHREPGMIRKPNSKCKDCKEPAVWGTNRVPRHCEAHKTSDDENLVERPCASCSLPYILDKEDKCENCNPASFQTARLAKQNALMDALDARNLKGDSTDKIVEGGACGRERPDRVYDFGDKIVILECDEHQHQERACACEQTRMVNIGQSFGGIPVYFIRWNPDDYRPEKSRKKPEDIKKRYKLVGDLLDDIKSNKVALPAALVSALYMYYDGWASLAEEEWKIMTPYA